MTFSELENNYLIEMAKERAVVNIISLINTIKECSDVNEVRLENYSYSENDYALNVYTSRPVPKKEMLIWYRYLDETSEDIVLIGIRDSYVQYSVEVRVHSKIGAKHIFSERERKYLDRDDYGFPHK